MRELARGDATIQSFVKIDHHDHAGLYGDSKQRDVPDPNGDAEVEAHHVLEQQTAGHCVPGRKDQHDGLSHRMEEHIEQDKDQSKNDWQDECKPLSRTQLELVFSRPLQSVAGGQTELPIKHTLRVVDVAAVVRSREVNINVAGKLSVFVAYHGWPGTQRDACYLAERNLRSGRRRDQYSTQRV